MHVFHSIENLRVWRDALPERASIGFVPTMGALHRGHVALIERARRESEFVVASIFVNPTQFNNPEDFSKYPQTLEADLEALRQAGCDAVFLPNRAMIYPDDYRYRLTETALSTQLEGAFRPGHFDGVLTVVLKLFLLVRPRQAYFGEKDWQQLQLARGMVAALFLPLEVVPCATVREADGLAMSSRNVRLSPQARAIAPTIYRALTTSATVEAAQQLLSAAGFTVEYVAELEGRRLAAVLIEGVRLIDNVPVPHPISKP